LEFPGRRGGQGGGQFNAKNCSTLLAVVTVNFSGMFLDNAEADAETEAGTLPDGFGRIERIKDTVRLLDAGTVVGEKNDNVGTIAHGFNSKDSVVRGGQGIDRIADDVEKYLHQLIAISAHARKD